MIDTDSMGRPLRCIRVIRHTHTAVVLRAHPLVAPERVANCGTARDEDDPSLGASVDAIRPKPPHFKGRARLTPRRYR